MLKGLFHSENSFFCVVNQILDLMAVSLLWLVCCLPVVTAGPACIALYYAVVKSVRKQRSYCIREFFRAFRANLKKGLVLWSILLCLAFMMLGADVPLCLSFLRMEKEMDVICVGLLCLKAVLLAGVGFWCLVLQSRYEEKLFRLAEAALYLFLRYFPVTLLQLLILAAAGLLLRLEPLLFFIVPGACALLLSFPTEPVLARLCDTKELKGTDRDTWFL